MTEDEIDEIDYHYIDDDLERSQTISLMSEAKYGTPKVPVGKQPEDEDGDFRRWNEEEISEWDSAMMKERDIFSNWWENEINRGEFDVVFSGLNK